MIKRNAKGQFIKGSKPTEYVNFIGKRYNHLLVIAFSHTGKDSQRYWKCKCDCGNSTIVNGGNLQSNNTKSCGCNNYSKHVTHHLSQTRFYRIWFGIKERCNNPKNKAYHNYHGRGIKLCERWLKFENFRDDMYKSYLIHYGKYRKLNTTVDRINNNGNYSPDNCRWATKYQQSNNLRNNVLLKFNNKVLTISEWSKITGINKHTIYSRLYNYKWTIDKALTKPVKNYQ